MQTHGKNYIDLEIESILSQLDRNRILSLEDRIELRDYFLNEVDNLNGIGLNDQEALLIAKKRFGALDEVTLEYQKVKPGFDILRFGVIGVVGFCLIKTFSLLINLSSQLFWMIRMELSHSIFLEYHLFDIPFRFLLIIVFGFIANRWITKDNFKSLTSFWIFPIIYIIAEVINKTYELLLIGSSFASELQWHMSLVYNGYIVNYVLIGFIMLFASYKLYKMNVLDMEYI
jgi:hypothetical protein